MQIQDKVVAVTGGARGIGKAIASAFAERGARIALLDLVPADVEAARVELAERGADVRSYVANVAKEDQVSGALDAVVADFGRLDVMVNNAGIIKDALLVKVKDGAVAGKMSLEQWQAVIDVNLTGVFLCGREAAERMIRLGHGGVIVNIASISKAGNAGQSNYGFTRTDILSAMPPEMLEKVTAPVPLKRLGLPEEVAQAAVFIAENDYFTGRSIDLDGGLRL